MFYALVFLLLGMLVVMIVLSTNPAPFYGVFNLVLVALLCCGASVLHGGTSLSLVLLMIYMGGMLVVFIYSSALSADKDPKASTGWQVVLFFFGYFFFVFGILYTNMVLDEEVWWGVSEEMDWDAVFRGDMDGVSLMYSSGGGVLLLGAWVLLLTLLVVLELVRGLGRGALRAV
uniref:NADH-ubiquinone oxidoreductase chain 6 n=1 Tax=Takifugu obscurus TaxID=309541 RepID=E6Y2R2_TAKOB|nr:NADH dehydrogenase subunit 6 [Takifugu obscurus]